MFSHDVLDQSFVATSERKFALYRPGCSVVDVILHRPDTHLSTLHFLFYWSPILTLGE